MSNIKVKIGADTSELEDGLSRAERAMGRMRTVTDRLSQRMQRLGVALEDVGAKMTMVSGAITAAAGGAFLMAKGAADTAREIQVLARQSNASVSEFQRMAAGAKTVGIEQDKLGDILKDVNDRVGDFLATGGGPMADFFENVAPKVGVTADQFARLSGPEALQLYVDSLQRAGLSQQQMTFYMEAMASDATRLIPLLQNGGAEMARLGLAAEAAGSLMDEGAIAKSNEFNRALSELMMAFQGVSNRFGVTLMPIFTKIMDGITQNVIPHVHSAIEVFGQWVEAFNGLDPAVQAAVGSIVAAFGVGGPALMAIGKTIATIGSLVAYFGPAGLIAAAIAGGVVAWQIWGDDVTAIIETINGKLDTLLTKALEAIGLGERAANIKTGAATGQTMFGPGIPGMLGGVAGAIHGAMGLEDAGRDMADGLVNGFQGQMLNRIPDLDSAARIAEEVTRLATETNSPSRVFHRLGTYLGDGFANGISESTSLVASAAADMGRAAVAQADASVSDVLGAMGQLFQGSKTISAGIALANSWLAFTEVLKDPSFIGRPFARFAAAASALSAGLNAVRNIKSAQPGGVGASGGGGAGGATTQAASQGPLQVSLNTFGAGDLINRADLGNLLDRLNREAGDRGYTILSAPA